MASIGCGENYTIAASTEGEAFIFGKVQNNSGPQKIKLDAKTLRATILAEDPGFVGHIKEFGKVVQISAGKGHVGMVSQNGDVAFMGESPHGECGRVSRSLIFGEEVSAASARLITRKEIPENVLQGESFIFSPKFFEILFFFLNFMIK